MTKRRPTLLEIQYAYGYHEGVAMGEYDKANSQLGLSFERIAERLEEVADYRNSEMTARHWEKYKPEMKSGVMTARKLRAWCLGWLRGYREEVR